VRSSLYAVTISVNADGAAVAVTVAFAIVASGLVVSGIWLPCPLSWSRLAISIISDTRAPVPPLKNRRPLRQLILAWGLEKRQQREDNWGCLCFAMLS
jgi:hypothetical protein